MMEALEPPVKPRALRPRRRRRSGSLEPHPGWTAGHGYSLGRTKVQCSAAAIDCGASVREEC
jgi:hypothetical protein